MIIALGMPLVQAVPAYLILDLIFRVIPLDPEHLPRHLRHFGRVYFLIAVAATLVGGVAQWYTADLPGLLLTPLNGVAWWLLWRFGLRKQFPFLFRPDDGVPIGTKKPDP